jgi:hypothetical protein
MNPMKTGFNDRIAAAEEAKKTRLAKFKPKPTVAGGEFVSSKEEREAELIAVRQARLEAKAAAVAAAVEAEANAADDVRKARKERKARTEGEQKARRDARYAARKAR